MGVMAFRRNLPAHCGILYWQKRKLEEPNALILMSNRTFCICITSIHSKPFLFAENKDTSLSLPEVKLWWIGSCVVERHAVQYQICYGCL